MCLTILGGWWLKDHNTNEESDKRLKCYWQWHERIEKWVNRTKCSRFITSCRYSLKVLKSLCDEESSQSICVRPVVFSFNMTKIFRSRIFNIVITRKTLLRHLRGSVFKILPDKDLEPAFPFSRNS